jgi:hypothetical protein
MANESWVFGTTATRPFAGDVDVAVVTTGATLTGSNILELRILKSSLGASANVGFNTKEHVLKMLRSIEAKVASEGWPPADDSLV